MEMARPISIPPPLEGGHRRTNSDSLRETGKEPTALDLSSFLQRSEASVVKTRTGSVLSRGFILKTDHYPSGERLSLAVSGLLY
jgi:hypothetical protein